jgi:putative transcriptional regulator
LTKIKTSIILGYETKKKRQEATMPIEVRLDMMLAKRKMTLTELSEKIGISITNLSLLKTGKVKGMRFSTLEAICRELECQPGDILEYIPDFI